MVAFFLSSQPCSVGVRVFKLPAVSKINSLLNGKILDWYKLKSFADDKMNVSKKLKFVLGRVENVVEKGENAGYQHFLPFPQCFQKSSSIGSLKVGSVCLTLLAENVILDLSKMRSFVVSYKEKKLFF